MTRRAKAIPPLGFPDLGFEARRVLREFLRVLGAFVVQFSCHFSTRLRAGGGLSGQLQKEAKNFYILAPAIIWRDGEAQRNKSFLVLFFKKELLPSFRELFVLKTKCPRQSRRGHSEENTMRFHIEFEIRVWRWRLTITIRRR